MKYLFAFLAIPVVASAYDVHFYDTERPNTEAFVCSGLSSLQYTAPNPATGDNGVLSLNFRDSCYNDHTPRPNPNITISVEGGTSSVPINLSHGSFITLPLPPSPVEVVTQGQHGIARIVDSVYVVYDAAPTTEAKTDTFTFRMRDYSSDYAAPWSAPVSILVHITAGGL